jgi:hypothetical protein
MSVTTVVLLNTLLDVAVAAALAAVLLRPFVLERREVQAVPAAPVERREELRRAA